MSLIYKCKRCDKIETPLYNVIKKHLNKKSMCKKQSDLDYLSDDQLLFCSIIPYNIDGKHLITEEDIEHDNFKNLMNYNKLNDNKKEVLNTIEYINKRKIIKCKYCDIVFSNIIDLQKHILMECYFEEIDKLEKIKEEHDMKLNNTKNIINEFKYEHVDINKFLRERMNINDIDNKKNDDMQSINNISKQFIDSLNINQLLNLNGQNNIHNIRNASNNTSNTDSSKINTTNNNNNNKINIFLEIKQPIPVENKWDISKIIEDEELKLIVSKFMYTSLLEEILKDDAKYEGSEPTSEEINDKISRHIKADSNRELDDNSDPNLIYKVDIDRYIQKKSKIIVYNTMEKLNYYLAELNRIYIESIPLTYKKHIIKHEFNCDDNTNIQELVDNLISSIFTNKKSDIFDIVKNILQTINTETSNMQPITTTTTTIETVKKEKEKEKETREGKDGY
jgi:hypothetical protein